MAIEVPLIGSLLLSEPGHWALARFLQTVQGLRYLVATQASHDAPFADTRELGCDELADASPGCGAKA